MITFALVGKGLWGKNYISTLKGISHCKLPPKYIKTHNYQDLFSFKDIDGVIIATPASTHFMIAKSFLERGYNVLIEKPVTTNVKDALILRKIAAKKGKILMVSHIYHYHPAFIKLKNLVRNIGKIKFIQIESMDWGPIRTDVSALWDWAPHDVAMCVDILEKKPISVSAHAKNILTSNANLYDMCFLKLNFPFEVCAFITIGWLSLVKKRNFTVIGKNKALLFDDIATNKLLYFDYLNEDIKVNYPSYSSEQPLKLQILEFIDCIKKGKKPKTGIEQAILTLKIIKSAEESILADGKEITF